MANVITVVIPVYNRRDLVARTLESLRVQTAPAFDVVLVDNGSTDGTKAVLDRWAMENSSPERPIKVLCEDTPGACAARNKGLSTCSTPWILFFDSDDEMLPQHIERVLKGIECHPQADVLVWNVQYGAKTVKKFHTGHILWYNMFEGNFATQRWATRTDIVHAAGAWNNDVKLWDDIELGARILAQNPDIVHLGKELSVIVHPHNQSISANNDGDYIRRMEAPLRSLAEHMPAKNRIWADYVRIIAAGNTRRTANNDTVRRAAEDCAAAVIRRAPSAWHRLMLRATYHFRRLGGRGQNIILKLWLDR